MKIGAMLSDTLRSLLRRPATRRYPVERAAAPARLRGMLSWDPERCTGCGMCVRDCPAAAIELITLDKAKKRFVLHYQLDRCTFCAQCVQTCNFGCLDLEDDRWELAEPSRASFTFYYGEGDNVAEALAQRAQPDAEPAAAR